MKIDTTPLNVSLLAFAFVTATHAWANPVAATVAGGSATITNTGATLTITNSPNTIINWQGFSISAGETTRFVQQSSTSAVLNRVTTQSASSILGSLQSNGRVFLVNPNGILFGSGAQVNTASFTATTLNISDSAFLSGNTATSGAGSTLSFDGLMTVNGSVAITTSGIVSDASLSFSGNVLFDSSGAISFSAGSAISADGTLAIATTTPVSDVNPALAAVVPNISIAPSTSNTGATPGTITLASGSTASTNTSGVVSLPKRTALDSLSGGGQISTRSGSAVQLTQQRNLQLGSGSLTIVDSRTIQSATVGIKATTLPVAVSVNLQKREPMF